MEKKRTSFSKTKKGRVNGLRWAYVTQVKLGRGADINAYLGKILDIIVEGTRFEEDIKAIRQTRVGRGYRKS